MIIKTNKYLHLTNEGDYIHSGLNICKISDGSIHFKLKFFGKRFNFWVRN